MFKLAPKRCLSTPLIPSIRTRKRSPPCGHFAGSLPISVAVAVVMYRSPRSSPAKPHKGQHRSRSPSPCLLTSEDAACYAERPRNRDNHVDRPVGEVPHDLGVGPSRDPHAALGIGAHAVGHTTLVKVGTVLVVGKGAGGRNRAGGLWVRPGVSQKDANDGVNSHLVVLIRHDLARRRVDVVYASRISRPLAIAHT